MKSSEESSPKEDLPLVSVVTVVYNESEELEKTIKSVISQDYENLEYIIVDGGSENSTLETIKKYDTHISHWVSEKDEGIYDAMNKGRGMAKGTWINFMNAGDTFASNDILSMAFSRSFDGVSVVYGNTCVIYDDGREVERRAKPLTTFYRGMPFCHQSSFTHRSIACADQFDTSLSLCSDYKEFFRIYLEGKKFEQLKMTISHFKHGGESSAPMQAYQERKMIAQSLSSSLMVNLYYQFAFFITLLREMKRRFR